MSKRFIFNTCVFTISILGLLMVYSASSIWSEYKYDTKYYYLIRQFIFYIIGVIIYFFTSKTEYKMWLKYANLAYILTFLLLILVLIPGIGMVRGGARSWIGFGVFSIQPTEFMKLSLIIFTSKFLTNNKGIIKKNLYFYLYCLFIGMTIGLIFLQPDFGSAVVILLSTIILLFIGEFQIKNIFIGGILLLSGLAMLIWIAPYRMDRITSFLDPWSDPLGSGFQIIQSLYAIAPASLFGYGLFNSKQKYFFLPEPQNDFIFAIFIEELGIFGGIILIALYATIIYIGYKLTLSTKDLFSKYLSFGITSLLMVQVFINIAVVIGLIPITGVTLPLMSYGGSSLIITFFMLGILNNIIKNNKDNLCFNHKKLKNSKPV